MLALTFSLLIVAAADGAPTAPRYAEAIELFRCNFDASTDANYDGWPDRWTRAQGDGYPHYVAVRIAEERSPRAERCLRVELDGGGAIAYSPPVAIAGLFSCVLEGYVSTKALKHDRAFLSLTLSDEKRHDLEYYESEKIGGTSPWQKVRLGPIAPRDPQVRYAVIGLHLEPDTPQGRQDIRGSALFTDLWLGCLPRLDLSLSTPALGNAANLFRGGQSVEASCIASGFLEEQPAITFELKNVLGKTLARVTRPLHTEPVPLAPAAQEPSRIASEELSEEEIQRAADRAKLAARGRSGKIAWTLPLPGPGFYRLRASVPGPSGIVYQRSLSLAVVEPRPVSSDSEFVWELPDGDRVLPLEKLSAIVCQAGVHRVQYPVWFGAEELDDKIPPLQAFIDRLSARNVEIVGMLCDPPPAVAAQFSDLPRLSAADVFGAPSQPGKGWKPALEPLLARLANQISWWQLGNDRDTSFVDFPQLADRIEQIRGALGRLGPEPNVGFGWRWINQLPAARSVRAPWQFLALSAQPPLTADELTAYLQTTTSVPYQRWVVLEPLGEQAYDVETRAEDLLRRILAAKRQHAEAIVAADPLDARHGLLNSDGSPNEMFIVWRNAALLLGGAQYLGSMELPQGSRGEVFSRGNEAVMVVWNHTPCDETLYLGEHPRQIDLWGQVSTPAQPAGGQVIHVEGQPSFVTGLHPQIARWRMDCSLAVPRLPALLGVTQDNALRMKNSFPATVSGTANVAAPEGWSVEPREFTFHLGPLDSWAQPLRMTLPLEATCGRQPLRIDFQLQAETALRFSVYLPFEVGLGDVRIELHTQLDQRGQLQVEQSFVNTTSAPVSFRCELFAPGRQRQRHDIFRLVSGNDAYRYLLPDGKELLGRQLGLRATEIGGPRILNYLITAEK